jgi:hypothetical protein
VGGNGADGFPGDGGPATGAELSYPDGAAVIKAGDLLIADEYDDRIRKITPQAGQPR